MAVLLIFSVVLTSLVVYMYVNHKLKVSVYWSERRVPHLEPVFAIGNAWRASITEHVSVIIKRWYLERKKDKILGFWIFTTPTLLVTDLDIMKRVLIKDFSNFRDKGFNLDMENDPLNENLFILDGKRWRNLRVKLTPTFTSGKMKAMFPIMVKCGDQLRDYLKGPAESSEVIDFKDVLARFTTDVISSCAFGIDTNSLENPKSEFREFGKKVSQATLKTVIINILHGIHPAILKILKVKVLPQEVTDFFVNTVRNTIEYREKNNIRRNDFLQLIIQLMRTGKIEDVDKMQVDDLDEQKFSLNQAAAQCFVFFLGGFETSSTALTLCFYELAFNPDIQKNLQREIDEAVDEITYDVVADMKYLDMVVKESLRKYPAFGVIQRKCASDYYIPELDVTIEKGTDIILPALGVHYDPDIYPDPEKFDPERFEPEANKNRDPITFLPFGEGPRNCIGNRFALLQIKVAIISVLRSNTVEVSNKTPIPLAYDPRAFMLGPRGDVHLAITKRDEVKA